MGIGIPTPTTSIATVDPCVPSSMATEEAAPAAVADPSTVRDADAGCTGGRALARGRGRVRRRGPDHQRGRPAGVGWSELTEVTRPNPGADGRPRRGDAERARAGRGPVATAYRPVVDDEGVVTEEVVETGYLGVTPQAEYVAQPVGAVPATMWDVAMRSGQALLTLPVRVFELAQDMIAGEERDPESPVSVVGIGRISGEVVAAEEPVMAKVAILVSLMASLNLFLFLFNLMPVLPLDGGHVAGAMYEGGRRPLARWRGRPDPGPVDVSRRCRSPTRWA